MNMNVRRIAPYVPISVRHYSFTKPIEAVAFDCVKVSLVREGSAILSSQIGQRVVTVGDAVLLCTNTLCAVEPEECFAVTIVYIDTDYLVDQVFWQHVGLLSDRLDAKELASKLYVAPVQLLHIGEQQLHEITPCLDELVVLTADDGYAERFYRIQSLWFALADKISPLVKVSSIRLSPSQRERQRPTMPRHRRFAPLRVEARRAAELLRDDLTHHWTVNELSSRVHLSESQLSRVFAEAYGKTPMAYLAMSRVEELARLLRETDMLVEDAVGLVGWRSMSYAIRVFREYVGMTPGTYRRTHNAVA